MKLVCRLCDDRLIIADRDVLATHVDGHRLVGDAVRVYWASANALVAKTAKSQ